MASRAIRPMPGGRDDPGSGVSGNGRVTVVVPVETALAYTAERGWHVLAAPPAWWVVEQERLLATDPLPVVEHMTSRRRVRLTAAQRRENARQAAVARWAGQGVDARREATAAARAAQARRRVA